MARAAAAFHPAAFLETAGDESGPAPPRLIDPDEEWTLFGGVPRLIEGPDAVKLLNEAKHGDTGITISIRLPAPAAVPVTFAMWPLSCAVPTRRYAVDMSYLPPITITSAAVGAGVVFPGANDDGSGTVSVIEIARALARMPLHPKRSILFMTFFGEEEGSLDRAITRPIRWFRSPGPWRI